MHWYLANIWGSGWEVFAPDRSAYTLALNHGLFSFESALPAYYLSDKEFHITFRNNGVSEGLTISTRYTIIKRIGRTLRIVPFQKSLTETNSAVTLLPGQHHIFALSVEEFGGKLGNAPGDYQMYIEIEHDGEKTLAFARIKIQWLRVRDDLLRKKS